MKIGAREIGNGGCFVIAEAGLNHNGSIERCLEMVRSAAKAGADGFKIQAFDPNEFCGPEETYTYLERSGESFRRVTERQVDMFARCALSESDIERVGAECRANGIEFIATATDKRWIDVCLGAGVSALKCGSDDIVHIPLLKTLAATGKPLIISTGMATADEVALAIGTLGAGDNICVLHCVSSYPTSLMKANLLRMGLLGGMVVVGKQKHLVGYSDHTQGLTAASIAIARGASIVEKHFTLDKTLPGPDHHFSMEPAELASLCLWAKAAHYALGSGKIDPSPEELAMRKIARRSIIAEHDIDAGQVIRMEDLAFKRPGTGLSPAMVDQIVGQHALRPYKAGEQIQMDGVSKPTFRSALLKNLVHGWPVMPGSTSGRLH